jgi:hypothetical protein
LLNFLLILPIIFSDSLFLRFTALFSLSAIGPPLLYWVTMQARISAPLSARLMRLGTLVAMGTGLAVNNSRAVLEALTGKESAFKRTPKFAVIDRTDDWKTSNYALPTDPTAWIELILAVYAVALLIYAMSTGLWWLILWLLMYAAGFSYMAYLSFAQALQVSMAQSTQLSVQPAETQGS